MHGRWFALGLGLPFFSLFVAAATVYRDQRRLARVISGLGLPAEQTYSFYPLTTPLLCMNNSPIEEAVSQYIGSWNEQTFEAVKTALAHCCAADVTYTDKQTTPPIQGVEQLAKHILNTRGAMPGLTLSSPAPPNYFDNNCTYGWLAVAGEAKIRGCDYVEYNEQGLFTRVVAFALGQ